MRRILLLAIALFSTQAFAAIHLAQPRNIQSFTPTGDSPSPTPQALKPPPSTMLNGRPLPSRTTGASPAPSKKTRLHAQPAASSPPASPGTVTRSCCRNSIPRNAPPSPSTASWPTPTSTATENFSATATTAMSASTTISPRISTQEKTSSPSAWTTRNNPPPAGIRALASTATSVSSQRTQSTSPHGAPSSPRPKSPLNPPLFTFVPPSPTTRPSVPTFNWRSMLELPAKAPYQARL